jgi:hypothetical protein
MSLFGCSESVPVGWCGETYSTAMLTILGSLPAPTGSTIWAEAHPCARHPNPTFDLKPMLREHSRAVWRWDAGSPSALFLSLSVFLNISFGLKYYYSLVSPHRQPNRYTFLPLVCQKACTQVPTVDYPEQPLTHRCNARSVLLDQYFHAC